MTKHKVSELTGALLDVAVGLCEGDFDPHRPRSERQMIVNDFGRVLAGPQGNATKQYEWSPSTRWEHGGPIIERERISVSNPNGDPGWIGTIAYPTKPKRNGTPQWGHHWECGQTPLIAAMRAYVTSKLGDEVELP